MLDKETAESPYGYVLAGFWMEQRIQEAQERRQRRETPCGREYVLGRRLEQAELQFFGSGKRNGVLLGESGIAIMIGTAGSGLQHSIEAEVGKTVGGDVFPDLFD